MARLLHGEIEAPGGGELKGGGAAREALDGDPRVLALVASTTSISAATVGVPVTVGAEGEAVGGAVGRGWLRPAVVADRGPHVLPGQRVRPVHVAVARDAEPGGVRAAEERRRRRLPAVLASHPPPAPHATVLLRHPRINNQAFTSPNRSPPNDDDADEEEEEEPYPSNRRPSARENEKQRRQPTIYGRQPRSSPIRAPKSQRRNVTCGARGRRRKSRATKAVPPQTSNTTPQRHPPRHFVPTRHGTSKYQAQTSRTLTTTTPTLTPTPIGTNLGGARFSLCH
ncbi:hypothetical protein BHM03_00047886 [Ensete ventricosum]|nr:hypothetical protein BHM03_00047886 [Ensete ventricosum]